MGRETFKKTEHILARKDFQVISRQGRKVQDGYFIIRYRRGIASSSRLGMTVSKKVGGAVTRNRIKRYIREYFRKSKQDRSTPWDCNIIAKPKAQGLTWHRANMSLKALFRQVGKPCAY